jgi:plastocyanin
MNSKTNKIIMAAGGIAILLMVGYIIFGEFNKPSNSGNNISAKPTPVIPTRTVKEKKIIEAIKDYTIKIENNTLSPVALPVKAYDQIFWQNNDKIAHKVNGDGWKGLLIIAGGRFMHSFTASGTYTYTIDDNTNLKGTIVVR